MPQIALLNPFYVPGTVHRTVHVLIHVALTAPTQAAPSFFLYNGKSRDMKDERTRPRSHVRWGFFRYTANRQWWTPWFLYFQQDIYCNWASDITFHPPCFCSEIHVKWINTVWRKEDQTYSQQWILKFSLPLSPHIPEARQTVWAMVYFGTTHRCCLRSHRNRSF